MMETKYASWIIPARAGQSPLAPTWSRRPGEGLPESSLQQMDQQYRYPDHLRQIWETGNCLRAISEACQEFPVEVVKKILGEQGIIKPPAAVPENEAVEQSCIRIREYMDNKLMSE